MITSSNGFELILDEVIKQKQVLEELVAENEALRQQLADLLAGKGIAVDIQGHRYLLNSEDHVTLTTVVPAVAANTETAEALAPDTQPSQPNEPVSDGATAMLNETSTPALRDTSDDFLLEEISGNGTPFPATAPSFLEEAMLEEFANAATHQMHVWNGPITNHPTLDEKEKASLRRELMGSFLLE